MSFKQTIHRQPLRRGLRLRLDAVGTFRIQAAARYPRAGSLPCRRVDVSRARIRRHAGRRGQYGSDNLKGGRRLRGNESRRYLRCEYARAAAVVRRKSGGHTPQRRRDMACVRTQVLGKSFGLEPPFFESHLLQFPHGCAAAASSNHLDFAYHGAFRRMNENHVFLHDVSSFSSDTSYCGNKRAINARLLASRYLIKVYKRAALRMLAARRRAEERFLPHRGTNYARFHESRAHARAFS